MVDNGIHPNIVFDFMQVTSKKYLSVKFSRAYSGNQLVPFIIIIQGRFNSQFIKHLKNISTTSQPE